MIEDLLGENGIKKYPSASRPLYTNPIEHPYGLMDSTLHKKIKKAPSKSDLLKLVYEICQDIPQENIHHLTINMPNNVLALKKKWKRSLY